MNKRVPKGEHSEAVTCNGMTLTHTKTREYTFTIAQLKYAVTADKPFGLPVSRDEVNDLLKSVIRANRWELFGTHIEPYKIIFNGYGQFKSVECEATNTKLTAAQVFLSIQTHMDILAT